MREIQLKVIEGVLDGKPLKISYKAQLINIMETPMDGKSADLNEVRRSIRILDVLEKTTGDVLTLEDADHDYLKQRVQAARWSMVNRAIIQFVDDVTGVR